MDLTRQLSNPPGPLGRLLGLAETGASTSGRSAVVASLARPQRQVRLSAEAQRELVERHLAGAFKKELARIYGIHVETVRAIIARTVVASTPDV